MARLFPLRSETPATEGQPRVVDLEDEDADAVFGALSSTTAREIYTRLNDEPGTPSDVADAIDSSIQNVRYHLEKLENAGLVEVVDTWYSSRGNEMSVYATADGPLIVTSDQSRADQLKTAISRFIGGVAALAGGSLLVQYGLGQYFAPEPTDDAATTPATAEDDEEPATDDEPDDGEPTEAEPEEEPEEEPDAEPEEDDDVGVTETDDDPGDDAAETDDDPEDEDVVMDEEAATTDDTDDPVDDEDAEDDPVDDDEEETVDDTEDETVDDDDAYADAPADDGNVTADGGLEAADAVFGTIPPGALFFLGGLVVLTAVTIYWYWTATY